MPAPLLLQPVFHEKIWGGSQLRSRFNYPIFSDHTGECWGISGHPHGLSTIKNGRYQGQSLAAVWHAHPELFGHRDTQQPFPLLTKILDAQQDLSVQVHPDDSYARVHEHELGKTECWYVIHAEPDAQLYYGHHAQTRSQLAAWIHTGNWQALFRRIPIKTGDFFYVPAGTVHALGAGTMVLETQQSSDTTYRLYDFDRVDTHTHLKRRLHLKQAIDTIQVPHRDPVLTVTTTSDHHFMQTNFVQAPAFTVVKWDLNGTHTFHQAATDFTLVSILNGTGALTIAEQPYPLRAGDHLILPSTVTDWQIHGNHLSCIATLPGPDI